MKTVLASRTIEIPEGGKLLDNWPIYQRYLLILGADMSSSSYFILLHDHS